jgi:hypothetical protein
MTEIQSSDHGDSVPSAIPEAQLKMMLDEMRGEQNLVAGIAAGFLAAIAAAAGWAVISAMTGYQVGFMSIGVGYLVGIAIRAVGKGIDPVYGVVGAVLSLFGCLAGNLLTVSWYIAANENVSYWQLLSALTPAGIYQIMAATFDPMDILFYAIALYFGYRYSFRQIASPAGSASSGE